MIVEETKTVKDVTDKDTSGKLVVKASTDGIDASIDKDGYSDIVTENLTDEDKEKIKDGATVTLSLIISDASDKATDAQKKTAKDFIDKIEDESDDKTQVTANVGMYVDVNMIKIYSDDTPSQKIDPLSSDVNASIVVPDDLIKDGREF